MQPDGSDGEVPWLSRSCARACCGQWLILVLYWVWNAYTSSISPWHMFEDDRPTCADRKSPLPVNDSGVRLLVYGLSKTGTKTMMRSIREVGFQHSYHSEDLSLYVWSRLADRFWLRPENGGRRAGTSHGVYITFGRPLNNLNLAYSNDTKVLESLRPEDLAASLAACKVDAIAFDGMEHLFWPIYRVSPNAKVLILDWRTVNEWNRSRYTFAPMLMLSYNFLGAMYAGISGGPWVLVTNQLDRLFGSWGYKLLVDGGPPIASMKDFGVIRSLYLSPFGARRVITHLYAGLKVLITTAAEYNIFYRIPYMHIPAERRMSWNMKKHGYEDLCAFLGIPAEDCPRKGHLRNQPTWWDWEEDRIDITAVMWATAVLFHLVNWYVFRTGLTAYGTLLRTLRRTLGKGPPATHVE